MKRQIVTVLVEVPLSLPAAELAAIEGGAPPARTYETRSTQSEREPLTRDKEANRWNDSARPLDTPYGYGTFSSRPKSTDTFQKDSWAISPKEYKDATSSR
jgi:hypothetical protein